MVASSAFGAFSDLPYYIYFEFDISSNRRHLIRVRE